MYYGKIDRIEMRNISIIMVRDINTPLLLMDRITRKKLSKEIDPN